MTAISSGVGEYVLYHIHLFAGPKRWGVAIVRTLLLIPLLVSLSTAQPNEPKRVLILTQEDLSWPIFQTIDANARATLRSGSREEIQFFNEHMDLIHFPDPMSQAQKKSWVQGKYAKFNLDLVIGVGDVPTDIFPSVPLVYLSTDPQRKLPHRPAPYKNTASIWVELDVRRTLAIARQFQPGARQLVVIAGSSPVENALLDQVREQVAGYSNQFETTYLTNRAFPEISQKVSALGPETIVLFITLARDATGEPSMPAEAIGRIASVSGAPVYTLLDTHVGSGAIGGYVTRFGEMGKQAGEMGLQLLSGSHPKDALARSDYLFDWRQLQRWKISESVLPAGSIVLNRQPGIWELYKWFIIGAILLALAETSLLFGLLWQRAKKRRFQQSLVAQMGFEKMLADLSTTFINLPEEHVGAIIEKSLGRIAEYLKLDRITIFEYSAANAELIGTFSWHGDGVQPAPALLRAGKFPLYAKQLQQGETVLVSDVEELLEGASAERQLFRELGSRSVAMVPLKAGEQLFGAMSFAATKRQLVWTEELVGQLTLLGEVFSNALARKRAQEARFRHAAIVESSDDAIISKDLDGTILSWNAGAQHMFGFTEAEVIGRSTQILIPEELRDEEERILQRTLAGERIEHYETTRLTKDGKRLFVSLTISPLRDSAGVVVGASKIARDITERKRAEQILRESEDRFRLVANTAPVLIWMSGTEKLCTFFNQSWLKFTGRSMQEELGHGWTAGVHPEDLARCVAIYLGAFDERIDFEMEYRMRRFDGVYRWVVDFGVPRFEADGTFCGYIGSCVDITDRKSSEESLHTLTGRLIRAQEEERARIARELHDDFSQRLALLGIGLGQVWKKLPASDVEERASILDLLRATREISSDLHSLSHQLHSSKLEHVGLVPALHGLCKEISEKYKIEVHFMECEIRSEIPKDVALCLFRVAQEALGNVVKHSRAKGAKVEVVANAEVFYLRISDAGRGFDPDKPDPRAGIGLIGMSERLRLVGGTLQVRSEPGRGTEISAKVPLATGAKEQLARIQTVGA
jgi:PAS domain S-box-containing protein